MGVCENSGKYEKKPTFVREVDGQTAFVTDRQG